MMIVSSLTKRDSQEACCHASYDTLNKQLVALNKQSPQHGTPSAPLLIRHLAATTFQMSLLSGICNNFHDPCDIQPLSCPMPELTLCPASPGHGCVGTVAQQLHIQHTDALESVHMPFAPDSSADETAERGNSRRVQLCIQGMTAAEVIQPSH